MANDYTPVSKSLVALDADRLLGMNHLVRDDELRANLSQSLAKVGEVPGVTEDRDDTLLTLRRAFSALLSKVGGTGGEFPDSTRRQSA